MVLAEMGSQAALPGAQPRLWVYRNTIKALNWYALQHQHTELALYTRPLPGLPAVTARSCGWTGSLQCAKSSMTQNIPDGLSSLQTIVALSPTAAITCRPARGKSAPDCAYSVECLVKDGRPGFPKHAPESAAVVRSSGEHAQLSRSVPNARVRRRSP